MDDGPAVMKLRRPFFLFVERRRIPPASLQALLSAHGGGDDWIALAPHLDAEAPIESGDLAVFEALDAESGTDSDALAARFDAARIDRLVTAGLLLGDHPGHAALRARDQALRDTDWWGPAALAQGLGRWGGVDLASEPPGASRETLAAMIARHGAPPPATVRAPASVPAIALPRPARSRLDDLLGARSTCRNFAPGAGLPLADLATSLQRVFGAQASQDLAPGATVLKKNSPSGGGLHPIEAYVLAQRVDRLEAGLYHYDCVEHALEPLRVESAATVAGFARELVAGQAWFADAPVLVLMAARFQRNFWKYRRHSKAWKVVLLDAGHLAQNFQLSATEQGYGAFVTGAINDRCAERLFGFDGLSTGAIAVCGMGRRAARIDIIELDPLGLAPRGTG